MANERAAAPHPAVRIGHARQLFINGQWCAPLDGGAIAVISPVDGAVVAEVACAGPGDMTRAVAAARAAFDDGPWPRLSPAERIAALERFHATLAARRDELADYWTLQIGALRRAAPMIVGMGLDALANMLETARGFPFEREVASSVAAHALVVQEPVGVVAAIVPWNSPFMLLMAKLAPALVAGCTVVMKPSPETPLEAYVVAECAEAAGLPPGVLNLVPAERAASAALVADPGVDKVSFTGSTQAGRDIAAVCAARVARCTLELGGKSAVVMLDDYPVDTAAQMMARTIIALSGQVCSMLSRAVVPRHLQEQLAASIAREMASFRVGDPDDPATDMGPVASRRQAERVLDYIRGAQAQGARLVTGGAQPVGREGGCFVEPTLFTDVRGDMTIAQEEVFGPVLCLIPHDGEDDAIRIANDTIYGLNGAVLTNDAAAAYRVARRVRSGKFAQNAFRVDFAQPSGGMKQSGIGREGGDEGLKAYLETKVMLMDAPAPAGV